MIDELSFTALAQNAVVGHVTASRAKVGFDSVVAVGPIGVLPDHQANGIGSALMNALLSAADAQDVPLVVLLGSPQYYGRFGFRPAVELGVMPPEPKWGSAFQARPLRAYTPSVAGPFEYAPAFSSWHEACWIHEDAGCGAEVLCPVRTSSSRSPSRPSTSGLEPLGPQHNDSDYEAWSSSAGAHPHDARLGDQLLARRAKPGRQPPRPEGPRRPTSRTGRASPTPSSIQRRQT